ncbi:MAG: tripartite tricarboxylate transporter substrate binding protein [Betaproteobacteria bacterium]
MRNLILISWLFTSVVFAQAFPTKPLRIVVPFAVGGSPDVIARGLAIQLDAQMGKSIVVDNRAGANGIIGADIVAKSAPDGHTLIHSPPAFVLNALVYKKLPYDVMRDFIPVTNIGNSGGYLMLVSPALGVNNLKEFIAAAKAKPLSYGSPPAGNTLHLATEMLKQRTGMSLQHVPYKGGTETFTALISGEVQVLLVPPPAAISYVKSGRLRAIGFTGAKRHPILPEVPTLAESGVADYVIDFTWHGWFAPAKTPLEIVRRLQLEARKALQAPAMRALMESSGFEAVANTPEEFKIFVQTEMKRYAEIVRAANVVAE